MILRVQSPRTGRWGEWQGVATLEIIVGRRRYLLEPAYDREPRLRVVRQADVPAVDEAHSSGEQIGVAL